MHGSLYFKHCYIVAVYVYKCSLGNHPGYTVWLIVVLLQKWAGARHVGSTVMVCVC